MCYTTALNRTCDDKWTCGLCTAKNLELEHVLHNCTQPYQTDQAGNLGWLLAKLPNFKASSVERQSAQNYASVFRALSFSADTLPLE